MATVTGPVRWKVLFEKVKSGDKWRWAEKDQKSPVKKSLLTSNSSNSKRCHRRSSMQHLRDRSVLRDTIISGAGGTRNLEVDH